MNESTFVFKQHETDANGMQYYRIPAHTMLLKGVSHRSHNSAQHIASASFIPTIESIDFGYRRTGLTRKIFLEPQDFCFLTTEFQTAMLYATNDGGRVVSYATQKELHLINLTDYNTVTIMMQRYNLSEQDFEFFFKFTKWTKTVERTSTIEEDYKVVNKLMQTDLRCDFDGYVFNANWPQRTAFSEKFDHDEVLIFDAKKSLTRGKVEYRLTGLGYHCSGRCDALPYYYKREQHFVLIVDEFGHICGSRFLIDIVLNDEYENSLEQGNTSDVRDTWLCALQKLPCETRYDTLIGMMNKAADLTYFEPYEPRIFNLHRFDDERANVNRFSNFY